jgi:hypothetical protein
LFDKSECRFKVFDKMHNDLIGKESSSRSVLMKMERIEEIDKEIELRIAEIRAINIKIAEKRSWSRGLH